MKQDPALGQHLATFGINISQEQKTIKSMAELELEQNMKFDFSMVTDDGKSLVPIFGKGFTGLKNIGNRYTRNQIIIFNLVKLLSCLDDTSTDYFTTV